MKTSTKPLPPLRTIKILDQLRERIRYLHYSLRTEEAYVYWVRGYIRFHLIRHPSEMGAPEVEAYLSWLANERKAQGAIKLHQSPAFYRPLENTKSYLNVGHVLINDDGNGMPCIHTCD